MKKHNKELSEKEIQEKFAELKILILKQPTKRKGIKKEIARLLTLKNKSKAKAEENK